MTDRRRNGLILLLVLGLLAASLLVIATKPTRLGLDLKGGVELVYQGEPTQKVPEVTPESVDRALEIIRSRVDALGVGEPEIQRSGRDQISVGLPDVQDIRRAQQQVGTPAQLYFYDWEENVLTPDGRTVAPLLPGQDPDAVRISQGAGDASQGQTLYDAVALAARQRAVTDDRSGSRFGDAYYLFDRDRRYLAGPERSRADLLSAIDRDTLPPGSEVLAVPQGYVVLQAVTRDSGSDVDIRDPIARFYVLRDRVALSGGDIKDPQQGFNELNQPDVEFRFSSEGKRAFHQVTRTIAERGMELRLPGVDPNAVLQHFAVALDGRLISVASIDPQRLPDGIDGENGAVIEGGFTIQSAQDLAKLLQLGALPIGLRLISQSQVSASLGRQALDEGLVAGAVGLVLVALFLIAFYRVLGVVATGALLLYGVYLYALVKLVPVTMTLPGIAGLILTIGVAADANIVIFERVKEEVRAGKSVAAAIRAGYSKGITAIIDANVVIVMTAFILFMLATAGVKGFAFMLGIGTLVSLFTAVLATQAILGTIGGSGLLTNPKLVGGKSREWRIDFIGKSKWLFSMSGVILAIGALAIAGLGVNFGIDFTAGTRITTAIEQPYDEGKVRDALESVGATEAKVQRVENPELGRNVVQISTEELQPSEVQRLRAALDERFGGTESFSSSSVGPTFGETIANNAIVAIIASLLLIAAYISLRFQWRFAVPVLVALMHDILIVSGLYALTGREVTSATIAALLTILGYSLYDTIIVFDRIRENLPRMPRAAFSQVANRSLSEVLTRSIATSASTALPVLALLIFGGETLGDFAFALLMGVISGAYSSLFIAAPLLAHWKEREPIYAARRERIIAEHGYVPAYAVTAGGAPVDVEPERRRLTPRHRLTMPEDPGQISREEFEELARDLDIDDDAAVAPPPRRRGRAATATPPPPASRDDGGRAPDEPENDGVVPQRKRRSNRRNRRHGRNR